ncbi:MAG: TIGR01210 family radical SAM protein, partial [Promethearchaeota archaeon]
EEIKRSRKKSLKNKSPYPANKLEKPVSYWTKEDRLIGGKGKAFTVILRTRGCSWALEHGGCSMCGYIEDANIEDVEEQYIISQFNFALENTIDQIENDKDNYVLKIFNSGSFFDDTEITKNIRTYIYKKVAKIQNITEFIVESRAEFITEENLENLTELLPEKYIEIGIGLESVDNYVRNVYIHKGLSYNDFLQAVKLCHTHNIGVKAYLLFKPPFLNEQAAIDDCINSVKTLIDLNIETVSINPCNIQKGSFVEYLWYQKRYRPPWYYSLFKCLRNIWGNGTNDTRILCDPSGAGSRRGIHNCRRSECNKGMFQRLKKSVLNQNPKFLTIPDEEECICKKQYEIELHFHS